MNIKYNFSYPILQTVPFRGWVVEYLTSHWHHNLAKEIISTKHVTMPHTDPHCSSLHFVKRHHKLKNKAKLNLRNPCYIIST